MKQYIFALLVILSILSTEKLTAQVPYFAGTVGDGKLYGYTSLKFRPGVNAQETYTTFQYGLGSYTAAGLDLYTSNGNSYSGILFRGGYKFSKWFGIGGQVTPSFSLNDNFKFSYLTSGLYMNGNITANGRLFWCSNTWLTINDGSEDTIFNWEYLGYNFPLHSNKSITPMVGLIHSWKFDQDADLAVGFYYTFNNWNLYVWGNDFLKSNPRIVVGIDSSL